MYKTSIRLAFYDYEIQVPTLLNSPHSVRVESCIYVALV